MNKVFPELIKAYRLWRLKYLLELTLRKYGDDSAVHNRIAIVYAKVGKFNLAESSFEYAKNMEPSASSFHNLGVVYFEMKKYKKSLEMLERAIELDGNTASRHIAHAKVLEKLNRPKDTIAALERAFNLNPTSMQFNILHDAYMRNGMKTKASDLKKMLNKINKKNKELNATERLIKSTREFNDRLDKIAKERGLV